MKIIDADAFIQDVYNSIEEMTAIGVVVDGEYLWAKMHDALDSAPIIKTKQAKYYDEDEKVWKIGEVIVDE